MTEETLAAKAVHDAMVWAASQPGPALDWQNGNSIAEDRAREVARDIIKAATAEQDALLERALVFVTECADEDRADAVALMMEIEHVLGGRDDRD